MKKVYAALVAQASQRQMEIQILLLKHVSNEARRIEPNHETFRLDGALETPGTNHERGKESTKSSLRETHLRRVLFLGKHPQKSSQSHTLLRVAECYNCPTHVDSPVWPSSSIHYQYSLLLRNIVSCSSHRQPTSLIVCVVSWLVDGDWHFQLLELGLLDLGGHVCALDLATELVEVEISLCGGDTRGVLEE